jgi:ketosteroid isomerase-like protein
VTVFVLAVLTALGGASDCGPDDPGVRAVLRLEDQWASALVRRDAATFQRLLADGFIYSEDDRTMTRDAVLREIVSGSDTVQAARNEEMKVHCFGTTAIVTGWLIVQGRGAAGGFERRYRYTDIWMLRDGRWQIIAAHDYLARPTR